MNDEVLPIHVSSYLDTQLLHHKSVQSCTSREKAKMSVTEDPRDTQSLKDLLVVDTVMSD
jgi:hypothetical protein